MESEKRLRRQIEALRAQAKVEAVKKPTEKPIRLENKKAENHLQLPLRRIKKDLLKTTFFTVFVVALLFVMQYFSFSWEMVVSLVDKLPLPK